MLNSITIHGRLCRDPELKTTQSGISVCSFSVAVDRSYAKQGEEKQTDFFDVNCWRGLAEMAARYFTKGKEILVHGAMQSRKYTDRDGNNRIAWSVLADSIDFCGSKSSDGAGSSGADDNRYQSTTASKPNIDVQGEDFTPLPDDDLPF